MRHKVRRIRSPPKCAPETPRRGEIKAQIPVPATIESGRFFDQNADAGGPCSKRRRSSMIAAPRKMRSQAPLVYSQSFIWQLPRVVTALRWPNESAASPPFAGIRLAALLRSRSVARSRTRCGSRSSPCLIPHRLTTLASAASVSGSESDTAISGIVPATRMRIRPLYTRHQWATCSSVSCVVRLCPLLLPSNGVVLNFLKIYQNSNTVGCRRRGGTWVGPPRLDPSLNGRWPVAVTSHFKSTSKSKFYGKLCTTPVPRRRRPR
jgi:hypothetical protein